MLPEVEKELEMFDSFNDYQIFGPHLFFYGKLFYFLCEKAQNEGDSLKVSSSCAIRFEFQDSWVTCKVLSRQF